MLSVDTYYLSTKKQFLTTYKFTVSRALNISTIDLGGDIEIYIDLNALYPLYVVKYLEVVLVGSLLYVTYQKTEKLSCVDIRLAEGSSKNSGIFEEFTVGFQPGHNAGFHIDRNDFYALYVVQYREGMCTVCDV
jgi:hypothetical protein